MEERERETDDRHSATLGQLSDKLLKEAGNQGQLGRSWGARYGLLEVKGVVFLIDDDVFALSLEKKLKNKPLLVSQSPIFEEQTILQVPVNEAPWQSTVG